MRVIYRAILMLIFLQVSKASFSQDMDIPADSVILKNFNSSQYVNIEKYPKAKGVAMKLKVPTGWKVEKNNPRPGVVISFQDLSNIRMYVVVVTDNFTFFSKKESARKIDKILSEKAKLKEIARSMIGNNVNNFSAKKIFVDRFPALEFTLEGQTENAGYKITLIIKSWIVYYEDKIITLMGSIYNTQNKLVTEAIYKLITNSVVFPEQYE